VRETEILVEQQPPQGVLVCDHAGLVISKFSSLLLLSDLTTAMVLNAAAVVEKHETVFFLRSWSRMSMKPFCVHTGLFARIGTRQVCDQKNSYGVFILKLRTKRAYAPQDKCANRVWSS